MKNSSILILAVYLAILTACRIPQTKGSDLSDAATKADVSGDTASEKTNASEQTTIVSTEKAATSSSQPASSSQTGTEPRIYRPDELLTAEEATSMVRYTVTLEAGSLYASTDLGYISKRYVYDIQVREALQPLQSTPSCKSHKTA